MKIYEGCNEIENAVAPDWNLKLSEFVATAMGGFNAVAPDWNLKKNESNLCRWCEYNAVAPDWNLKTTEPVAEEEPTEQCSRTRLEFKVF